MTTVFQLRPSLYKVGNLSTCIIVLTLTPTLYI